MAAVLTFVLDRACRYCLGEAAARVMLGRCDNHFQVASFLPRPDHAILDAFLEADVFVEGGPGDVGKLVLDAVDALLKM